MYLLFFPVLAAVIWNGGGSPGAILLIMILTNAFMVILRR